MFSLWPITTEQRKPREDPRVQGETRFVNRKRHRVLTQAADKQSSETGFPNARRREEEQRLLVQWQHHESQKHSPCWSNGDTASVPPACHLSCQILVKFMFYSSFCTINESLSSIENNWYLELSYFARHINYLWENRQIYIFLTHQQCKLLQTMRYSPLWV